MNHSKKILTGVVHTAQMGISGIEAVKQKAQNPHFRQLLQQQQRQYSEIEAQSYQLAHQKGWDIPPRNMVVDKMSCMCAKCRVLMGDPDSTIAGMLIQGNTRGMILGIKNIHRAKKLDPAVSQLANKMLNLENINIQKSQPYL